MTDKERLEEIKKELELDWSDISYVVNQNDVKWLINRVEELEEEVKKQKNRKYLKMRQRDDFMKKAQHYKQALENITISPIPLEIDDAVNIARQALESEE